MRRLRRHARARDIVGPSAWPPAYPGTESRQVRWPTELSEDLGRVDARGDQFSRLGIAQRQPAHRRAVPRPNRRERDLASRDRVISRSALRFAEVAQQLGAVLVPVRHVGWRRGAGKVLA
jgi:hypothetical protein